MTKAPAIIGLAALAAGAAIFALRPLPSRPSPNPIAGREMHVIPSRPEFYDPEINIKALQKAEIEIPPEAVRSGIRAVVVPHHLLAASLIARTLRTASGRPIDEVVIIGPNHADAGGAALITADAAWTTPGGTVETSPEAVASLVAATGASRNAAAFDAEHSVGAIVPFVEAIFPEARIVPVMAASSARRSEAEALAAWIAARGEGTLVVFSIDFSHYLPEPEALRRDAETRAAIERGDVERLLGYSSEHLDAPAVMAAALLSAREAVWAVRIEDHATANDFLEIKASSITTYFTLLIGHENP